jgi:hypothetical protein
MIKFVITVNFEEFSTRQLLMAMFGFITIKLFRALNITIRVSINSVTIQQRYILHLLCDIFSLTRVWVYFMILCSLNNFFLAVLLDFISYKIKKKLLLTLYLYRLSVCSIFLYNTLVQATTVAENNIRHVHITLLSPVTHS